MRVDRKNAKIAPSPFGLGTAGIGNLYKAISDDQASACLSQAAEHGLLHWDTAPFYGLGLSETRIGRFIRENPQVALDISTKVGRTLKPTAHHAKRKYGFVDPLPFEPVFDYSGDAVERSIDESSHRLYTDRFGRVFFHDLGTQTHGRDAAQHWRIALGSGLERLQKLRAEGRIGCIGIGANEVSVLNDALQTGGFDTFLLAGRYTLFEHERALDFMNACADAGVEIVIGGPYNSGLLATRPHADSKFDYAPASEANHERASRIWSICEAHGVPASAAALQFAAAHPAVVAVVAGAQTLEHIDSLYENAKARIPSELWNDLRRHGLLSAHAPLPSEGVTEYVD